MQFHSLYQFSALNISNNLEVGVACAFQEALDSTGNVLLWGWWLWQFLNLTCTTWFKRFVGDIRKHSYYLHAGVLLLYFLMSLVGCIISQDAASHGTTGLWLLDVAHDLVLNNLEWFLLTVSQFFGCWIKICKTFEWRCTSCRVVYRSAIMNANVQFCVGVCTAFSWARISRARLLWDVLKENSHPVTHLWRPCLESSYYTASFLHSPPPSWLKHHLRSIISTWMPLFFLSFLQNHGQASALGWLFCVGSLPALWATSQSDVTWQVSAWVEKKGMRGSGMHVRFLLKRSLSTSICTVLDEPYSFSVCFFSVGRW